MSNYDLNDLPEDVLKEHLQLTERLKEIERVDSCQNNFLEFVKSQWPGFIEGAHHVKMAEAFDRIAKGKIKRLIINMPPRHTKSEFASHFFPAYLVGRNPSLKILQATHTADLAVKFGRKIRDLIDTDDYKRVFPDVDLNPDSKAAGKWETQDTRDSKKRGEYYAVGTGGALAGRGADLFIIDDPHSEQEGASADVNVFNKTYEKTLKKFNNDKKVKIRVIVLNSDLYSEGISVKNASLTLEVIKKITDKKNINYDLILSKINTHGIKIMN